MGDALSNFGSLSGFQPWLQHDFHQQCEIRYLAPDIFERLPGFPSTKLLSDKGEVQRANKKHIKWTCFVHIAQSLNCCKLQSSNPSEKKSDHHTTYRSYRIETSGVKIKVASFRPSRYKKLSAKQRKTSRNLLKSSNALHQCNGHD